MRKLTGILSAFLVSAVLMVTAHESMALMMGFSEEQECSSDLDLRAWPSNQAIVARHLRLTSPIPVFAAGPVAPYCRPAAKPSIPETAPVSPASCSSTYLRI